MACYLQKDARTFAWLLISFFLLFASFGMSGALTLGHQTPGQQGEQKGKDAAISEVSGEDHKPRDAKFEAFKPAAHLTAVINEDKLNFVSDSGLAFLKGGMKLENNELVIPSDGVYFVYNKVAFQASGCGNDRIIITCTGSRTSDLYPDVVPLFTSTKYACGGRPHEMGWLQPFFHGAAVILHKGDRLSVTAQPLVNVDAKNTYFGAFAI